MRVTFRRPERDGSGVANIGKYGLIVAVLSAATLTVALAIASRLAAVPPAAIG